MTIYDFQYGQTLIVAKPTLVREDAVSAVYRAMGLGYNGYCTIVWELPVGVNPSKDNFQGSNYLVGIDMANGISLDGTVCATMSPALQKLKPPTD